ncbi:MAG: MlaD family protein [Rhodospirillales bacterium]|nr:MlaD family protein [Rhodospirillales bacterium]
MTGDTKEVTAGALVLAALALVLIYLQGGQELASKATKGEYVVKAAFNRVDGLGEGAEVRLGGIKIGAVSTQTLDAGFRAQIDLLIDSDVKLPVDTSAAIHTDGLFGDKYVVLEPGGEEEYLKNGGRITFTQDAVIVSELLELIISQGKASRQKTNKGAN